MTKIKERNYLGLGIVFAIVALAISMMFLSFSYANENAEEQTPEQQANKQLTVTFEYAGQYDESCTFSAELDQQSGAEWNNNVLTLPVGASNANLANHRIDKSQLVVTFTNDTDTYWVTVKASTKDKTYSFDKYEFNAGTFTDSQTVKGYFKNNQPGDYNSVTISGKVQSEEKNDALVGADVSLGNDNTGEIYATTHSDANGYYELSGINAELFKTKGTLAELDLMSSYPNKNIHTEGLEIPTDIREGIGYISKDINMGNADIAILGSDFHKKFVVTLDAYLEGEKIDAQSYKWTVENVGFGNWQIPKGATFTIDENGVFSGRADQEIEGAYVILTCKPVAQDGYTFDYCEMDGVKYHRGDSVTFPPDSKGLTAIVHYANGTGEGQIAQTGDAIPFVAIAGLGIIAAVAFVVARKRIN